MIDVKFGTEGGNRTHTEFPQPDFESSAIKIKVSNWLNPLGYSQGVVAETPQKRLKCGCGVNNWISIQHTNVVHSAPIFEVVKP